LVLASVGAQLTHDRSLGHVLLRKRRHDALDVRPFLDDQGVAGLAHWLDEAAGMVGGVAEIDQAGDPLVEIAVARRELVSVKEQQPEVDLVGAVGVGGVPLRLDVCRVVVQDVEDEVGLVLVGTMMRALQGTWLATRVGACPGKEESAGVPPCAMMMERPIARVTTVPRDSSATTVSGICSALATQPPLFSTSRLTWSLVKSVRSVSFFGSSTSVRQSMQATAME
jgi:hypothetical protein